MRSKHVSKFAWLFAIALAFSLGGVTTATAAKLISGKSIKAGTLPYSAFDAATKKTVRKTYWAFVNENAVVVRSSGGVHAVLDTNGGTTNQYQVTFPVAVSNCSYFVQVGDSSPRGSDQVTLPGWGSVTRSDINTRSLAIELFSYNGSNVANLAKVNFFVQVIC